ncbi:MAG: hypothetical protein JO313_11030 [Verrucomicrobia bacterium]|nr:hypothetical protein [Verrucomicrobiota bacterium]MBV9645358.1 hypothetical protein [Verrucomicrobiota bacterium]
MKIVLIGIFFIAMGIARAEFDSRMSAREMRTQMLFSIIKNIPVGLSTSARE